MSRKTFPKKESPKTIESIRKRDGSVVAFDGAKIRLAIEGAALEVLKDELKAKAVSGRVTAVVIKRLSEKYRHRIPSIESIQDMVEASLMSEGYSHIAKSYIIYRERRSQLRLTKTTLGLKDDLKLPINSIEVLKRRYLIKDDNKNIIETPSEMFRRVAFCVARAEKDFKSGYTAEDVEEQFYQMMRNLEFLPNSPTLMNAGTSLGQLSACFVIPVEDSMEGIFNALRNIARIHQSGGGTGFNFSRLRPRGDLVSSTKGEASGPVSFMDIFDKATGVIVQGGRRRGANMGILRCDHPDIIEFIEAKIEKDRLPNFNLSVGITEKFMQAVKGNKEFNLVNPRSGKKVKAIRAKALFDLIVNAAWRTGEPGLIFLDEINRTNPTPQIGRIEATNPCGELPLLAFESCNLASINLAKMVKGSRPDWQRLKELIRLGIRFLDDVIEVNKFPLPQIKEVTFANRKVGLGVMGFADMLIKLGIPYNSRKAVLFASKLMSFIHKNSLQASMELAKTRGVFPNFKKSVYAGRNMPLRNATVNSVAPTGTISIIAGCSSGIEPLFAVSFIRNVLSGTKLLEVNPLFEEAAKEGGFFDKEVLAKITKRGSLKGIGEIPGSVKRIFVTAFDITARHHLHIQAAFQSHTDNSVSKTINLSFDAAVDDVRQIYLEAHRLRCKGITIYRYGSRQEQVLAFDYREPGQLRSTSRLITAESEYSGGCASGSCLF